MHALLSHMVADCCECSSGKDENFARSNSNLSFSTTASTSALSAIAAPHAQLTRMNDMAFLDTVESSSILTHDSNGHPWRSPHELNPLEYRFVPAPPPENEDERLAATRRLRFDHPLSTVVEEWVRLAAELCGCEAAGLSLVDSEHVNIETPFNASLRELPRSQTMCGWTILSSMSRPFSVSDVRFDRRFVGNPLVKEMNICSYIGAPLIAHDAHRVGTLFAISSGVVEMTPARLDGMQHLAEKIMREIETDGLSSTQTSLRDEKQLQQLSHELRTPLHSIVGHAQLLLDSDLTAEQATLTGDILKSAGVLTRVITNMLQGRLTAAELAHNVQLASKPWEDFRKHETGTDLMRAGDSVGKNACSDSLSDAVPIDDVPSPHISPHSIAHVQQTWAIVSIHAQAVSTMLTDTLFDLDPRLRALFPFDLNVQRAKLMKMVSLAVRSLQDINHLVPELHRVGRMHSRIGVMPRMYPLLNRALLQTLQVHLAEAWTFEVSEAWAHVLGFISTTMIEGDPESLGDMPASADASRGDSRAYIESAGLGSSPENAGKTNLPIGGDFSNFHILSVDDNAMNRLLMTRMMARLGLTECREASDGQECLDILASVGTHFDCVFLDLQMPVMGGTVACLRIHQRMGRYRPFLVAITADTTPGVGERCRDAGFDAILRKPCTRRTIQETLIQAASWRRQQTSTLHETHSFSVL